MSSSVYERTLARRGHAHRWAVRANGGAVLGQCTSCLATMRTLPGVGEAWAESDRPRASVVKFHFDTIPIFVDDEGVGALGAKVDALLGDPYCPPSFPLRRMRNLLWEAGVRVTLAVLAETLESRGCRVENKIVVARGNNCQLNVSPGNTP